MMLRLMGRSLSLGILSGAIAVNFAIILFLIAVVLAGEGPVVKGSSCQLGISKECIILELQEERKRLRGMERRNRELMARNKEMAALVERLSALDHASESYVVFFEKRGHGHTVSTGHTYASLLNPETLIGAHCYVHVNLSGAGTRQVRLGNMSRRKRVTLNSYSRSDLRGTGLSVSDITKMQALCQWPEGAR